MLEELLTAIAEAEEFAAGVRADLARGDATADRIDRLAERLALVARHSAGQELPAEARDALARLNESIRATVEAAEEWLARRRPPGLAVQAPRHRVCVAYRTPP